jgi:hypothetical protein
MRLFYLTTEAFAAALKSLGSAEAESAEARYEAPALETQAHPGPVGPEAGLGTDLAFAAFVVELPSFVVA